MHGRIGLRQTILHTNITEKNQCARVGGCLFAIAIMYLLHVHARVYT